MAAFFFQEDMHHDMTRDCPVLRIRLVKRTLECELANPNFMQIVQIRRGKLKITQSLRSYTEIVKMVGNTDPKLIEFKPKLKKLEREVGRILSNILKGLAVKIEKDGFLSLALDTNTVKIPWELARIRKRISPTGKADLLCNITHVGRLRVVRGKNWEEQSENTRIVKALVVGINYEFKTYLLKPLLKQPAKEIDEKYKPLLQGLKQLSKENALKYEDPDFLNILAERSGLSQKKLRGLVRRLAKENGIEHDPLTGTLDQSVLEAEKVKEILKNHNVVVTMLREEEATKEAVIKELEGGVDIFHFTGHGGMSGNEFVICLHDSNLNVEEFENAIYKKNSMKLTFFNACETSIDSSVKGNRWAPYNWAFALAEQGARAFIGTLWSVNESDKIHEADAPLFAETFFEEFKEETSLGEAMWRARERTKTKNPESDALFTWPAYVLYGTPSMFYDELIKKFKQKP